MNVILLSGVSGAGKSTYIQKRFGGTALVCSADHFFMVDGEYKFDPTKLSEAHGACLRQFILACQDHYNAVEIFGELPPACSDLVVDNTNLTTEELAPYVAVATAYKLPIEIVTLEVQSDVAAARSLHVNAEAVIDSMQNKLSQRKIPVYWKVQRTFIYQ